jgi:hypothetical protein
MPEPWRLESGPAAPEWFRDAVLDGRVLPVDPVTNDWFRNGARILATGQVVELSGLITEDMIR